MGPHDGRYKLFFYFRRMMADLIRGFLRERWLHGLDLETLEPLSASFVSEQFQQRHGDCLWRVRAEGPGSVSTDLYLLVEFQSRSDRFMPLRILVYEALLLEQLLRRNQLAPGGALPLVIALVVQSGKRPWSVPLDLRELFAPAPKDAVRLLPGLSYLLIDRARMDSVALDQPDNVAAAFFRIEEARSPLDLVSLARPLARLLPEDSEPELRRAFTEFLVRTLRTAFPEVRIPHVEDLEEISMLEENMIRWRKTVIREGLKQGREQGLEQGLEQGREQGREQGFKQGRKEGRKEGQVDGMRRVLLKQMKLRFGPLPLPVRRQLREISSLPELEALAGRLLTAGSLADLGLESP